MTFSKSQQYKTPHLFLEHFVGANNDKTEIFIFCYMLTKCTTHIIHSHECIYDVTDIMQKNKYSKCILNTHSRLSWIIYKNVPSQVQKYCKKLTPNR